MSPAVKEAERLILSRRLAHDGNPVMRWCLGNVAIEQDAAGNVKVSKGRSRDKVDGAIDRDRLDPGALGEAPRRSSRRPRSRSAELDRDALAMAVGVRDRGNLITGRPGVGHAVAL